MGKLRPQILTAILGLVFLGWYGMANGSEPVAVGALAGIIALAKDVLAVDS
jgi:hypothetical protein